MYVPVYIPATALADGMTSCGETSLYPMITPATVAAAPIRNIISIGAPANLRSLSLTSSRRKKMPSGAAYRKMSSYSGGAFCDDGINPIFASTAAAMMTISTAPMCEKKRFFASHSETTISRNRTARM